MWKIHAGAGRGRTEAVRLAAVAVAASAALAGCGAVENQTADQSAGAKGCDKSASFPSGPVELIVPWEAGGGTDSVARFLGTQLSKELGTQVNVVNRTGGSGVVGHSAIASAPADGSTIGLATVEITMMHWQGLTDLDQEELAPVAQVNADPAAITVSANAPYDDAKDLVAAAQKNPGALTASGTGRGGIWDLARAGMLIEAGADPGSIRWVPSDGAAPALQELVAGGIDVSFASLVENQTMLKAGKVKALGVMSDERDPRFPDVPTLKEQGIEFEMSAWRGIAGPAGLPDAVVAELSCTLDAVVHGDAYTNFMKKTGFGVEWRGSTEFAQFMQQQDTSKGKIMKASGLTS
jgi:tripartite-type tricarboxylate transporter receptor subunit TctC